MCRGDYRSGLTVWSLRICPQKETALFLAVGRRSFMRISRPTDSKRRLLSFSPIFIRAVFSLSYLAVSSFIATATVSSISTSGPFGPSRGGLRMTKNMVCRSNWDWSFAHRSTEPTHKASRSRAGRRSHAIAFGRCALCRPFYRRGSGHRLHLLLR